MTAIIDLEYGRVEGGRLTEPVVGQGAVWEYRGIPYCTPPVGRLRFARPQVPPHTPDEVVNPAARRCLSPPQTSWSVYDGMNPDEEMWNPAPDSMTEDSLILNVWAPEQKESEPLPVLVWIYGGGFISGSANLTIYNGAALAAVSGVVVVNFNYRTGLLGGLLLDGAREDCGGNQGIWDQQMALTWVQKHISFFHGNPGNVTLCGNSAGGASVSLHLTIRDSWPLFHRAVMQSGVCYSHWAFTTRSEATRRSHAAVSCLLARHKYGGKIWNEDCSNDIDEEDVLAVLAALRTLDWKEFIDESFDAKGFMQFGWSPFADGELISDDPRRLFEDGRYKQCPVILLNVRNEADYFLVSELASVDKRIMSITNRDESIHDPNILDRVLGYYPSYPHPRPTGLLEKVMSEYDLPSSPSLDQLDRLLSHCHFISDSLSLTDTIASTCSTVYYLFYEVRSIEKSMWPAWVGVMHSDEVYTMFGLALTSTNSKTDDDTSARCSREFMQRLTEFCHTGIFSELPQYKTDSKKIIVIDNQGWRSGQVRGSMWQKVTFWNDIRKQFI